MRQIIKLLLLSAVLGIFSCTKGLKKYIFQGDEIGISRLGEIPNNKLFNIDSFPRLAKETDDRPRFERVLAAMSSGDTLQLNSETYSFSTGSTIGSIKDGITIRGEGWSSIIKVDKDSYFVPFFLTNVSNVVIRDLKVQGFAQSGISGADLIRLYNSDSCELLNLRLESSPAQGISVGEHCNNNMIKGILVTNCKDSNTGCGLILAGADCSGNTITDVNVSWSRIGISINGLANNNNIGTVICSHNFLFGFTLDGLVGNADGASFNVIDSVIANFCGSAASYGAGIYVANGSTNNIFNVVECNDGYAYGIYCRSDSNLFKTVSVHENASHGIRQYSSNDNRYGSDYLSSIGNGATGIYLESGERIEVGWVNKTNDCQQNGDHGVYVGPDIKDSYIYHLYSEGNEATGVYVATGGIPWSNTFDKVNSINNVGSDYFWGTITHYWYW